LWIYGRRDYTISVMGANIYPEDLEQCLYAEPELARMTRSFCLSVVETPGSGVRPCFLFEVESELSEALRVRFAERMLTRLVAMNADFREAFHEYPDTVTPEIRLHAVGEGVRERFGQDQADPLAQPGLTRALTPPAPAPRASSRK
jgi:phenylacetate-CoA ligase